MKAFSMREMFTVVIILAVAGVFGYIFAFNTLFMHNAFEIFWYMLYAGGCFLAYNIVVMLVEYMSGKEIVDESTTKSRSTASATK